MNEFAVERFRRTLADLLRPPPTPAPGKERFRLTWYDPVGRRHHCERFAAEPQARERFHEVMNGPRAKFRLVLVERGRDGDGWEVRSTLKDQPKRPTQNLSQNLSQGPAKGGRRSMKPAERAATLRRIGVRPESREARLRRAFPAPFPGLPESLTSLRSRPERLSPGRAAQVAADRLRLGLRR